MADEGWAEYLRSLQDVAATEEEPDSLYDRTRKAIPPNARMILADILGVGGLFTEEDLSQEDLLTLREIAFAKMDAGGTHLDYPDYGINSLGEPLLENMQHPEYNLKTLIGATDQPLALNKAGEMIVRDSYDFNDAKDINSVSEFLDAVRSVYEKGSDEGAYAAIRRAATFLGSKPGEGAPVEINLGMYRDPRLSGAGRVREISDLPMERPW